jgi:hypothetical protein
MLNSHKDHLTSEGFTPKAIEQLQTWGVRSITNQEAKNLGIAYQGYSPSGLWFPFQGNFGQLRCDRFLLKYLSPGGSTATPWNPDTEVVTEGFKDAAAGTLMGLIPTTAIAGVTHYRSLPKRGQTVVFDSDATSSPNGFTALVRAAIFLGGKAVAIPQDFGQKAGLVEFFREFSPSAQPDAYQELLATAMTPLEMLYHLPSQWQDLSGKELEACVKGITLLARDFPEITGDRPKTFALTYQQLLVILASRYSIDSRRRNPTGSIPAEITPVSILPSRCRSRFVWLDRTVKPWLVLLQTATALLSISPQTSVGYRSCWIVGGSATLTREDSLRGLVRCRGLSIESCNPFGDRHSGGGVYQHCPRRRFGAMFPTGSDVVLDVLEFASY